MSIMKMSISILCHSLCPCTVCGHAWYGGMAQHIQARLVEAALTLVATLKRSALTCSRTSEGQVKGPTPSSPPKMWRPSHRSVITLMWYGVKPSDLSLGSQVRCVFLRTLGLPGLGLGKSWAYYATCNMTCQTVIGDIKKQTTELTQLTTWKIHCLMLMLSTDCFCLQSAPFYMN